MACATLSMLAAVILSGAISCCRLLSNHSHSEFQQTKNYTQAHSANFSLHWYPQCHVGNIDNIMRQHHLVWPVATHVHVAWSLFVGVLVIRVYCAKMVELIEMPFGG